MALVIDSNRQQRTVFGRLSVAPVMWLFSFIVPDSSQLLLFLSGARQVTFFRHCFRHSLFVQFFRAHTSNYLSLEKIPMRHLIPSFIVL